VALAGTVAEEMIFEDVSTGAQNDLERATEIVRSMVMEYGMSRLGRVNYREGSHSAFVMPANGMPRERTHSEQTAREIDNEVMRITDESIAKVREIIESRRAALVGLAEKLIEQEVIDADELRQIIEANSPSPQIVPGTDSDRKRPTTGEADEGPDAQQAGGS
jgi:cell division protease FtsH